LIFRINRGDKQRQGKENLLSVHFVQHKITAPFDSEILRLAKAGTVAYQAVQNLLPDILLVLGWNSFLAPLLNGRKPCLNALMLPGGPLFPFNPAISFLPRWQDSFSHSCFIVAK
jgi:hypothetical protein